MNEPTVEPSSADGVSSSIHSVDAASTIRAPVLRDSMECVVLAAAHLGAVRLIDNFVVTI